MICCPLTSYDGDESERCVVMSGVVGEFRCCECLPTEKEHGAYERATFYKCNCDCDYCLDLEHHRCIGSGCNGRGCKQTSEFYTCAVCLEIREHFACDGFYYGQLWEDLCQNFFPNMVAGGPCLQGLSPKAKGALFDAYLEKLEDTPREWTEHWEAAKDECATTEEFKAWLEDYGTFERSTPPAEQLEID